MLARRAGFKALYLSGAALSASMGLADLGIMTVEELTAQKSGGGGAKGGASQAGAKPSVTAFSRFCLNPEIFNGRPHLRNPSHPSTSLWKIPEYGDPARFPP